MEREILISDTIVFDAKPDAVPYNYRISYKLGQICLILFLCGGRKSCSFLKIQMIANAMNDEKGKTRLLSFCNKNKMSYTSVRFDPAVNRAIKYAMADQMITQLAQGNFKLTEKGKNFVRKIQRDNCLLKNEKEFLNKIGKQLTEEKIADLMETWRYIDATS
ncbi:hypothetical protein [Cuneatibacter caecimuris]|uniref:Uncharacterized protein n=1 Tax=Cuneatibacter caecimuris TaxID=1796618 RepID=A0A4Q7PU13_9FIRM|nr:hypothetical protein [Cuneatibacter caecimuris]RZT02810.1 hypothetical protein EV209_0937 [Cuneatibacter caecimuris]